MLLLITALAWYTKVSIDDCGEWSNTRLIYAGASAYSCLTVLPDGNIGLFFEAGKNKRYEKMVFVSFPPEELFSPGPLLTDKDF